MMTFEEFKASKFFDPSDPLLAKHPDNPALLTSDDIPYNSVKPPLEQYLYKGFGDQHLLIAKESHPSGERYCIWWGQGGDECYDTLAEAEWELFKSILADETIK